MNGFFAHFETIINLCVLTILLGMTFLSKVLLQTSWYLFRRTWCDVKWLVCHLSNKFWNFPLSQLIRRTVLALKAWHILLYYIVYYWKSCETKLQYSNKVLTSIVSPAIFDQRMSWGKPIIGIGCRSKWASLTGSWWCPGKTMKTIWSIGWGSKTQKGSIGWSRCSRIWARCRSKCYGPYECFAL